MKTKQNITASIDELACFIARLVAVSYEHDGKRLDYNNLKEIYRMVTEDLKAADFKTVKKEFNEILLIKKFVSVDNTDSETVKRK